jgi:hypothetical protein
MGRCSTESRNQAGAVLVLLQVENAAGIEQEEAKEPSDDITRQTADYHRADLPRVRGASMILSPDFRRALSACALVATAILLYAIAGTVAGP